MDAWHVPRNAPHVWIPTREIADSPPDHAFTCLPGTVGGVRGVEELSVCACGGGSCIASVLGRGTSGVVVRALGVRSRARYALKVVMAPEGSPPRETLVEVDALRRFRHENIVRLLGVCTQACSCAERCDVRVALLVFPFLPGRVLWPPRALAPERVVAVASAVASALEHMHERGYVHCDVKSSNVHEDAAAGAVVTDMGLCSRDGEVRHQREIVTLLYRDSMLLKKGYDMCARWQVDVFALGCIIAELACGRTLFSVRDAGGRDTPGRIAKLLGDSPFREIVRACTDPDPALRPTASAVRSILQSGACSGTDPVPIRASSALSVSRAPRDKAPPFVRRGVAPAAEYSHRRLRVLDQLWDLLWGALARARDVVGALRMDPILERTYRRARRMCVLARVNDNFDTAYASLLVAMALEWPLYTRAPGAGGWTRSNGTVNAPYAVLLLHRKKEARARLFRAVVDAVDWDVFSV